jgi:MurNAc alpha-1-phosphate uridylyltransferase
MGVIPHTAMILAAGLGQRMRPLTDTKPKPLLEVGGRAMLDIVLDRVAALGVARVVINLHYKGEVIREHLKSRSDLEILFSPEDELLDTGGGIKAALPLLGDDPVFVINADLPWMDGKVPALKRMADTYNAGKMDALLLLMPLSRARGFPAAKGDFFMEDNGAGCGPLERLHQAPPRPYVFISAQIINPQLFAGVADKIFSTNIIWDKLEERGRLYGLVHDGSCFHVGTPPDLMLANQLLASGEGW